MRGQLLTGFAAVSLLAGCGEAERVANVTTVIDTHNAAVFVPEANQAADAAVAEAPPALNLAPDGLTLVTAGGATRHLAFGQPRDVAVPLVSAAIGKPTGQGANPECGAGPLETVDFARGLTLFFQEGAFAGWDIDGRAAGPYATAAGIGIGATRAQLEALGPVILPESTIGHEFIAGDLSGLLDGTKPESKVTSLWAGTTCIFR